MLFWLAVYYLKVLKKELSRKLRLKAQVLPSARMGILFTRAVFSLELRKLLSALFPDARRIDGKT